MAGLSTPGERLSGFVRHLRSLGWSVGLRHSQDALNMLNCVKIQNLDELRQSLKILLCSSSQDWTSFDVVFDQYWCNCADIEQKPATLMAGRAPTRKIQKGLVGFSATTDHDEGENNDTTMGGAGTSKGVGKTDFRFLRDRQAYRHAARLAERMARQIRKRPSRRWRQANCGNKIDMRRTLHDMARRGDLNGQWVRKKRKPQERRLVLVLDVSHSMSYYSPILARFVRALALAFRQVEVFCFHVDLHRITSLIREQKAEKVIEAFESKQGLWFGGTKISESLKGLNDEYSHLFSSSKTTVLLFSDGFDTMDAEGLNNNLKQLRRQVHHLYWIDPNLTRARAAGLEDEGALHEARQWIDAIFPGDSLEGLKELADTLQNAR